MAGGRILGNACRSNVRHCRIISMLSSEGAGGIGGIGPVAEGTANNVVTAATIWVLSSRPSLGSGFGSQVC